MVNRKDAWGQYRSLDDRAQGNARTLKGKLTRDILIRHFRGAVESDLVGLHTTSEDRSRWLAIDIDHHGPKDKDQHRTNRQAAIALYEHLKQLGFRPLLVATNGRGGYHLIVLFDAPVPTPTVYAFGKWLVQDWQQFGFAEAPELFPKQPTLGSKKYGNFLRLPGRHHTRKYYSRVWNGKKWASGANAIRAILRTEGTSAARIPAAALQMLDQSEVDGSTATPPPVVSPEKLSKVQKRALALLRKKLKAVQGRGGDKVTWTAACYLVKDFNLTVEQALPVLMQWNTTHCHPPWEEDDLLRKLERADEEPGPRGRLLKDESRPESSGECPASEEYTGESFCVEIPDFVLADWDHVAPWARPRKRGRPRMRDWIRMVAHLAITTQKTSAFVVPDVLLAQVLWGRRERWPKRWRRQLLRTTKLKRMVRKCPPTCPLHDRADVPHRHFPSSGAMEPKKFIGRLHFFHLEEAEGVYKYDFRGGKSHHPHPAKRAYNQGLINYCKRRGWFFHIYLPAWLFGPTTLKAGPCRILQALTRELTRDRAGGTARPDRAEILSGKVCPLLDQQQKYVAFAGNGRKGREQFHGQGYRLTTWMERAAYATPKDGLSWDEARRFLKDCQTLHAPFGIEVVGYHPQKEEWQPLERMVEFTRMPAGRQWLKKCRLLVYGPEEYLQQWRQEFARQRGFSFIPGGWKAVLSGAKGFSNEAKITSALELHTWMRQNGLTDRELAQQLGVSQATVSYQHSGSRPWSRRFEERLAEFRVRIASSE